jgi:hypothetical protein
LFEAELVDQPDSFCLSGFEEMASDDIPPNYCPKDLRSGNAVGSFGIDELKPLGFRITSLHTDIVRELKTYVN